MIISQFLTWILIECLIGRLVGQLFSRIWAKSGHPRACFLRVWKPPSSLSSLQLSAKIKFLLLSEISWNLFRGMPGWKEGWGRPPRMLGLSNQLLKLGRVLRLVCIIKVTGSLATKDICIPFIMLTLVSITVKSSTTYSQQNRWRSNYSLFINCWHAAGPLWHCRFIRSAVLGSYPGIAIESFHRLGVEPGFISVF